MNARPARAAARRRPRVRPFVALVITALTVGVFGAATLLSVPATAASGPAATAATSSWASGYAVDRPVCTRPVTSDEFTCMAYRRFTVAAGTPGAYRYSVPKASRGPAGGITPAGLAKAYGINPNASTNQTVAIVDWNNAPHIKADLNAFNHHYGIASETAKSFRVVNENGRTAPLPTSDRDASVEITLDVQAVRSVCRRCKIILVEATSSKSADLANAENTAVRLGAKVVSNSFGSPEHHHAAYSKSFVNAFTHKGVVITAASGDDGWKFWDIANDDPFGYSSYAPESPSFPASLPTVVSVGGTKLNLRSNGTRASESVWNGNGHNDNNGNLIGSLGASGGGCSNMFAASSWQTSVTGYRKSGCAGKRLSVDVAADADPSSGLDVYDTYGIGGWATIGGTSLAAPLVAGMWGLAGGAHGMATPVQALYQNLAFRKSAIYDVTTGGNAWCAGAGTGSCANESSSVGGVNNPNAAYGAEVDCSFPHSGQVTKAPAKSPECNAMPGYDGASGVGTPAGLNLFRTTVPRVEIATTAKPRARHAVSFTVAVHRVISRARVVHRSWSWGDGTNSTAAHATTSHRFARAGTYRVRSTITDSLGQRASTTRTITVR